MSEIIVKTQEELDNIPLDYHGRIIIKFGTAFNPAILKKSYGYASAVLWDNASAVLRDNASAVLWDNASAVLWDNAQIVDVCRSGRASVSGNARVVYLPQSLEEFISHYGIKGDGEIKLYKAVHKNNEKYFSDFDNGFEYRIGEIAVPDNGFDGDASKKCGAGINMAPIHWRLDYGREWSDLAILEMTATREDVVVPMNTDGKVRARKAKVVREVPLSECGIYGEILAKRRGDSND